MPVPRALPTKRTHIVDLQAAGNGFVRTRNSIATVRSLRWRVVTVPNTQLQHFERKERRLDGRPSPGLDAQGQTTSVSGRGSWRGERRSGGATLVMVMQAADVRDWDDRAAGRRWDNPRDGSIFVQREVSAPLVVVNEVALPVASQ